MGKQEFLLDLSVLGRRNNAPTAIKSNWNINENSIVSIPFDSMDSEYSEFIPTGKFSRHDAETVATKFVKKIGHAPVWETGAKPIVKNVSLEAFDLSDGDFVRIAQNATIAQNKKLFLALQRRIQKQVSTHPFLSKWSWVLDVPMSLKPLEKQLTGQPKPSPIRRYKLSRKW